MSSSTSFFPAFIIGGAAKSGTTSLSKYLSQHPDIYVPNREPNFYTYAGQASQYKTKNHPFISDIESYSELLKPVGTQEHKRMIGEKSVSYFYKEYCHQVINNIQKYHPDWGKLKWIFILRHPVERAYSQYIHNLNFHESLPFREAIDRWPDRCASGWIPAYDYLGAGLYSAPLQAYLQNFKQVKVFLFEDLTNRPEWLLNTIARFLGIDGFPQTISFKKFNASGVPRNNIVKKASDLMGNQMLKWIGKMIFPAQIRRHLKEFTHQKPPLSATDKKELTDFFIADLKKLEPLINRDLSHWYEIE